MGPYRINIYFFNSLFAFLVLSYLFECQFSLFLADIFSKLRELQCYTEVFIKSCIDVISVSDVTSTYISTGERKIYEINKWNKKNRLFNKFLIFLTVQDFVKSLYFIIRVRDGALFCPHRWFNESESYFQTSELETVSSLLFNNLHFTF